MNDVRIAISGKSGCGNTTVSRLLAERLGIALINYTFRSMAEEEGVTFEQMCLLAEQDDHWDRTLDERQVARARDRSCVLGSRLAAWLLTDATLTVYLSASLDVRASRIQQREGGRSADVRDATAERDRRDRARYLALYDIDIDRWDHVDLVVETDQQAPEAIVDRIVVELERRGALGG